ncbi:MAG: hypothetical protein NC311_01140 [Muribaculaceae bacterium]|nr:hypothetical protein [Muribaculaceae bacterium]
MMNIQLRNLLLKSIPYLLSIVGGLVLFLVTKDNVHNPDWVDLINNIAASLLSIPVVFLLYDYSNYRIARKLSNATATTIHDRIDTVMISIIVSLRKMMGMRDTLTFGGLNKMADLRVGQIASRIKMTPANMKTLTGLHNELNELIYQNSGGGILSLGQVQTMTDLSHNVQRLINTHRFHQDRRVAAHSAATIIRTIIDLMDTDASAAVRFEQLLSGTPTTKSSPTMNK